MATASRPHRVMAALGLVRYAVRPAFAGGRAAAHSSRDAADDTGRLLRVRARGADRAPTAGPAAMVWAKVLEWLGRSSDDIGWESDHPEAIELPPPAAWTTSEGKRSLWLALKAHARQREG